MSFSLGQLILPPDPGSSLTLSAAHAGSSVNTQGSWASDEASRNPPISRHKELQPAVMGWGAFGLDADSYFWPQNWNEEGSHALTVKEADHWEIFAPLNGPVSFQSGLPQMEGGVHPWITKQH